MRDRVRVCLVGAGGIAPSHALALRELPFVDLVAVVDPNLSRARSLAERFGIGAVHAEPSAPIDQGACDAAHLLVPPDLHAPTGRRFIEAGVHVLVEKPLATSVAEAQDLTRAAAARGVVLGVNHNQIFTPPYHRLKDLLASGDYGRVMHVEYCWNKDFPVLEASRLDHWSVRQPRNIVFEQASHPLSQIYDLVGAAVDHTVLVEPARELPSGSRFHSRWQVSLRCERGSAQLFFSLGTDPSAVRLRVLCEGGIIEVDVLEDRVMAERVSSARDFARSHTGIGLARQLLRQSLRSGLDEVRAALRPGAALDPEERGIRSCIASFYDGIDRGRARIDGAFGTAVVSLCERVTSGVESEGREPPLRVQKLEALQPDVAVLGGTGFLGEHVVRRLLAAGLRVNVMARRTHGLPALFGADDVRVYAGDIGSRDDVDRVVAGAHTVIDLAFGFGDSSWQYLDRVVVGGCRNIVGCCLDRDVERLVYASTISALYLGDPDAVITGATDPDPKFAERNGYCRAKSICEQFLMEVREKEALEVCILRPGVVVGEAGNLFHRGVGDFWKRQHCLCMGSGEHPLPFVLVEDAAEAFYLAATSGARGSRYNVVGDVRLSAREYVREVSRVLGRNIPFHPRSRAAAKAENALRWVAKRAIGRRDPLISPRDVDSEPLYGVFDTRDIKADLGWSPVSSRQLFIERGLEVHAPSRREA